MNYIQDNMTSIMAAAAVMVFLAVAAILWRTISPRVLGRKGQRIGITEYYEIDNSRRLVLLRRDNVEHLVLIGGANDILLESNIASGHMASAHAQPSAAPEAGTARGPKPVIFGERRAPQFRPADTIQPLRPADPEL